MPSLVPPPPRDQVTTRDADRFELCGEACLASALGVNTETVVTWLRQHLGEPSVRTGTTPQALLAFCQGYKIGGNLVQGGATRYVAAATGRRHYAVVAVWSDHRGNPIPRAQSARLHRGGIGHWLLGYGVAGSKVQVMQPWGGRLLSYDLGGGRDQGYGIEILRQVPTQDHSYVVKQGDTLGAIARREHNTVAQLLAANPEIKNKELISVGQRIRIPS
jgi:hypothetical protein